MPAGHCDDVLVVSPRGGIRVVPDHRGFSTRVSLVAGDNLVVAHCRRDGVHRDTARQVWRVRLSDRPTARIAVNSADGRLELDGTASTPAPVEASPIVRHVWSMRSGSFRVYEALPAEGRRITIDSSAWTDGEHFITLTVTDADGRNDVSTAVVRVDKGHPEVIDLASYRADWINRAIVYGVVPSLFGRSGLSDVTAALDRLAALGIDTLWIAPATHASAGDFGYAVTDHFALRTDFGRDDDLRTLLAAAKERGMRVVLDFVPNHLSDQHPYFADRRAVGANSPYAEFFEQDDNGEVKHYFEWDNLKNLNIGNAEVQTMLIEAFSYWLRTFDVDGFRFDVAWGPRQRAPEFWPRLIAELRRIKPDLLLLAEASARDPYYTASGFDAAYDWTDTLGQWAWSGPFDANDSVARRLRTAIDATPSPERVFRFLENNDTGPRFAARYGIELTRVAAAMLLTLPGLPGLFSGQEVGADYLPYEHASGNSASGGMMCAPHVLRPYEVLIFRLPPGRMASNRCDPAQ